jgi:hypothetical protein
MDQNSFEQFYQKALTSLSPELFRASTAKTCEHAPSLPVKRAVRTPNHYSLTIEEPKQYLPNGYGTSTQEPKKG